MVKFQNVKTLIIIAICSCVNTALKSPNQKPYVMKQEGTVTVELAHGHEEVALSCNVDGHPKPTDIIWTREGVSITAAKESRFDIMENLSLKITRLNLDDTGNYTCEVCNPVRCENATVTLKIYLKINNFMTNSTIEEGGSLFCQCTLEYKPVEYLEYKYYKGYLPQVPSPFEMHEIENKGSNVLIKVDLTFADEGWYTCIVYKNESRPKVIAYRSVHLDVTKSTLSSDVKIAVILLAIPCSVVVIIVTCVICICRQRKLKKNYERWIKIVKVTKNIDPDRVEELQLPVVQIEKKRIIMVKNEAYDSFPAIEYEFPTDWQWEIQRERISLGKLLGEGAFGKVVMAEACGFAEGDNTVTVAVKMLKDNHTDDDVKDLVSEMEIMKMIGKHPNVINLLGCCSKEGSLYVIVEFAAHGNLKDFLPGYRYEADDNHPDKKAVSTHQLISFASQIASGMEYLSSIKCIHRDLAARNILVSEGYIMKIADFGLARDVHGQEYYRKMTSGLLPLRWLAPESLEYRFFNTKTDVWSFGILLWEIMTLGEQPYQFLTAWENLLHHLKHGNRLEQPRQCPDEVYLIMKECWQFKSELRPTFGRIVQQLDFLCKNNDSYI